MATWEVRSFDVLGNAVDGYEINQSFREGSIMLPVEIDTADEDFINRLVKAGHLNKEALALLESEELTVEHEFENITVTESETAWAAEGDREPRYLDARNRHDAEEQIDPETERVEEVQNWRPVLELQIVHGREGTVPFLRQKMKQGMVLELRVDPEKLVQENGKADFLLDSYVDGEFFITLKLGKIDGADLGIGKNGKLLEGDADLQSMARVAMDAFLEGGGKGPKSLVVPKEELLPPEGRELLKQMLANVEDFYQKRVTHEEFGVRSRALWGRARELGVQGELAELTSSRRPEAGEGEVTRGVGVGVGDRVRFLPGAMHSISNFELDISGMSGTVTHLDPGHEVWIELDSLKYADELREWDNALHFDLDTGDFPQIEGTVAQELERRHLQFTPCGLNADWSVEAWLLTPRAVANRTDGAYYLLDTEDDEGNYVVVRRFLEEIQDAQGEYQPNPRYRSENQGIEEIIPDGPLTVVLDEYRRLAASEREL
jgi:hypothetical protein